MKRDPSLIPLSHDHHHALMRVLEIRQALRHEEAIARQCEITSSFAREQLGPHFVAEEEHLFPALREVVDGSVVDQLIADHRELERLATASSIEMLRDFADLLERHIRHEEREVFRDYQDRMSADRIEEVGAAIKQALGR